jgi:sulfatase maturation enzyme AslB (radical SAM superfamily)
LPESAKEHASLELLNRVRDDAFLRGQVESINLSGGEPFLHPHLREFMDGLAVGYSRLKEICVNTDGHLLDVMVGTLEAVLPRCAERGIKMRIYISLDGIGQQHDRHRRHPGAFAQADLALRTLAQLQPQWPQTLRTTASFTITDRNADQILPVFDYVRALGVRVDYNLAARPEVFIGGAGLERRFQITPEQFSLVREGIRAVCAEPQYTNFSAAFYATMLDTLETGRRSRGCFFPTKGFVLMPDGQLYICGTYLSFRFGDLGQTGFEEAWLGAQRSECLSEQIPGKCASCFSNSYEDWDLLAGARV